MEPPPSKSPSPPLNPRGLTVWVVAVHVPLLALVQPVSVVNDADFPKPAVGAGLDNGISNTSLVEPPGCTHVETWTEDVTETKKHLFDALYRRRTPFPQERDLPSLFMSLFAFSS